MVKQCDVKIILNCKCCEIAEYKNILLELNASHLILRGIKRYSKETPY